MAKEIRYNPSFSVKKNAKNNGVSEATIRKYIKEKLIDRRFDRVLYKEYEKMSVFFNFALVKSILNGITKSKTEI